MQCINEMQAGLYGYVNLREPKTSNPRTEDNHTKDRGSDGSRSLVSFSLQYSNSIPQADINENHRKGLLTSAKQSSTVNLTYSITGDETGIQKHANQRPNSVPGSKIYNDPTREKLQTFGRITLGNGIPQLDDEVIENLHLHRNAELRARRASCLAKMPGGDDEDDIIIFSFVKEHEDNERSPLGGRKTLEISNNEFSKRISVYRTKEYKFLASKRSRSNDYVEEARQSLKNPNAVEKSHAEEVSPDHVELFAKFLVPNLKLKEVRAEGRLSYTPGSRKNLGFVKSAGRETIQPQDRNSRFRCSDISNKGEDLSSSFLKSFGSKGLDTTPVTMRFNQEVSLIGRPSYTRRNETTRLELEDLINDIQPDVKCIQDEEQPIAQVHSINPIVVTRMTPVSSHQRIDTEESLKNGGNKVNRTANFQNNIMINQSLELEQEDPECRDSFNPGFRVNPRVFSYKKSSTADTEAPKLLGRDSDFPLPIVSEFTPEKIPKRVVESFNSHTKPGIDEQHGLLMRQEGSASHQNGVRALEKEGNGVVGLDFPNRIASLGIKKYVVSEDFRRSSESNKLSPKRDEECQSMRSRKLGYSPVRDINTIESVEFEKDRGSLQSTKEENQRKNDLNVLLRSDGGHNLIDSNTSPQIKVVESHFSTAKTNSKEQEFYSPFSNGEMQSSTKRAEQSKPFNPFEYSNPFMSNLSGPNHESGTLEDTATSTPFKKKVNIEIEIYNSGYASTDFGKEEDKPNCRFSRPVLRESEESIKQHKDSKFKSTQATPKFAGDFRVKIENLTSRESNESSKLRD